ncbi:MAG: alanine racemase [Pseudomonadota bacterium]|nr:alanine racemase [Pseudomonadota bacterium]
MTRSACVRVDPRALQHNLARVREAASGSRVMAVVKANAYGHGALAASSALSAADAFAVANIAEALRLREGGVSHPILSLQGCRDSAELELADVHDIWIAVQRPGQIEMLEQASPSRPLRVWLKLNTGMNRLGLPAGEAAGWHGRLQGLQSVRDDIVLMTHLACADDRDDPATRRQTNAFDRAVAGLPGEQSIANSAGVLAFPETHRDWVRPGIMLYGSTPFPGTRPADNGLVPAMTFSAPLLAVDTRRRGDAIGYGGAWMCPEDMPVGVAAIGYADGYPRHAPAGTPVFVNGNLARLVGRVSMDMITIDLRGIEQPRVGDEVVGWGTAPGVDEVASAAGTIGYELLCNAGRCLDTAQC